MTLKVLQKIDEATSFSVKDRCLFAAIKGLSLILNSLTDIEMIHAVHEHIMHLHCIVLKLHIIYRLCFILLNYT